jgi:hypothetical protein
MLLAMTVLSAVLAVTAVVAVAGYLIDRGVRREEDER